MYRIRLDQDVRPLSEFRANAASLIQKVQESQRPLVLTQRGHSAAVVLGVSDYENLVSELELLRDVKLAEQQLAEGQGIPQDEARARIKELMR